MADNSTTGFERAELERPRGILNETDRELLMGLEGDLSDRAKDQRWVRLRRRVRNGILDAEQLRRMSSEQREKLFTPRDIDDLPGGALLWIEFLYMGLRQTEGEISEPLENIIRGAETRLAKERGEHLSNLRVEVNISRGDRVVVEEAREKLRDPDRRTSLSGAEIEALLSEVEMESEEWEMLCDVNRRKVDKRERELDKLTQEVDDSEGVLDSLSAKSLQESDPDDAGDIG